MPFNAIHEYDPVIAGNNTDIGGANIAEGCAPSGINNALRELARQVRTAVANQGNDIASAAATDVGAATGQYVRVTGTTTITSLGTVNAGVMRWVEFAAALTLTHNGTSLKLPGSVNIATAAGDVALFISLGGGNWKCALYSRADGSPLSLGSTGTVASTDAGATEGPSFVADRNSASPAVNDLLGSLKLRGRDSGANATDYAKLKGKIIDPTNGSEDGQAIISTLVAGAETDVVTVGQGVQIGAPTGGDPGVGSLNVDTSIQIDGLVLSNLPLQVTYDQVQGPQVAVTDVIPADDTTPTSVEGTQLFSRSITPKSATSRILIEVSVSWGMPTAGNDITFALFNGTTCIAVFSDEAASNGGRTTSFRFSEASGSTSARTYSLRYGPATAVSTTINETGAGNDFGNKLVSAMTITERLP